MQAEKTNTGYPSIDKPWLKYYSDEAINAPLPECTMYEYLWESNKDHLDDIALNYYDRKITYKKLFEKIELISQSFFALGIKKNDVVAICTVNTPEMVYALYALNRLGAIANMIDPRTNIDGIKDYFIEANIKMVLTLDVAYPVIKKAIIGTTVKDVIVISPADSLPSGIKMLYKVKTKPTKFDKQVISWKQFIKLGKNIKPRYAIYEKNICCVMAHTGGTTGSPKCVMLSNDNINAMTAGYRYIGIPLERNQRFFNDLPPFIIFGLCFATHTALCFGLEVILYPKFDSKEFPKQFAKYRPHHFCTAPNHLRYLCNSKITAKMDLSHFITVAVGGDSLSIELEIQMNEYLAARGCKYRTLKGFEMTELASGAVTASPLVNQIGSVGVPLVINNIKIVDPDTLEELTYNQSGEIWISSPSIMLGYLDKPDETAETIVTTNDGIRWIRTGDLGYITNEGLLFHQGRLRRIYVTAHKGQPAKIFPMLIEDVIKKVNKISMCSVVGRKQSNSENYEAIAFIVKDIDADEMQLRLDISSLCAKMLPSYMVPSEYRFVEELPFTVSGKVDFRALEREADLNKKSYK